MYLATRSTGDNEQLQSERVSAQPLSTWYSNFGFLKTLRQNEALLGTLIESDERGVCSAEAEGWVYLFVKSDFPATDIGASVPSDHADLTDARHDEEELASVLSSRLITYTPHCLNGYFIERRDTGFPPIATILKLEIVSDRKNEFLRRSSSSEISPAASARASSTRDACFSSSRFWPSSSLT
jgi:hypothetical protein